MCAVVNNAKFVIQVSKGLIRHQRARRLVMFYSILIALVLLFIGAVSQWPDAREHPLLFLSYWAVCGWITLLAVLLALYDLLKVRAEAQRTQRDLAQQNSEKEPNDENPR
jgi:heme/copper-type cytochrome/quinol oxidase subunit 2